MTYNSYGLHSYGLPKAVILAIHTQTVPGKEQQHHCLLLCFHSPHYLVLQLLKRGVDLRARRIFKPNYFEAKPLKPAGNCLRISYSVAKRSNGLIQKHLRSSLDVRLR